MVRLISTLILPLFLAVAMAMPARPVAAKPPAPGTTPVNASSPVGTRLLLADFENGFLHWSDSFHVAVSAYGEAPKPDSPVWRLPMTSLSLAGDAHRGRHCLMLRFCAGTGHADARFKLSNQGQALANAQVDEIAFWMKGDGSNNEIRFSLNAWSDNFAPVNDRPGLVVYSVPLSLKETRWHEVTIPLARLQASQPLQPLRLQGLDSLEFACDGKIAPAQLWLDDVVARNRRGEGQPFAASPFDQAVTQLKPPAAPPHLSVWGAPLMWGAAPGLAEAIGLDSYAAAGDYPSLIGQKEYLAGRVAISFAERPPLAGLLSGLDLAPEDYDQDAQGNPMVDARSSFFHPAVMERYYRLAKEFVRAHAQEPWQQTFSFLSPVSTFGECHYSPSTKGNYAVFSRPARRNFQAWMKQTYHGDLSAVARAWGRPLHSWSDVLPPATGPTAGAAGIDTRQSWSDFMHWYNAWFEQAHERMLAGVRPETTRPLALALGGAMMGAWQGLILGNAGPMTKMLGRHQPAYLHATDGEGLFSVKYAQAACAQYGLVGLTTENVGDPDMFLFHQYNIFVNTLACGVDRVNLCGGNYLFDKNHWFDQAWRILGPLLQQYRTQYHPSETAFFHSYLTAWYRPDRSNIDTHNLYDKTNRFFCSLDDMTRTKDVDYPSWGRALGAPDVLDDVMIEDGGLAGRKLLVIANSSVTLTTRKAVEAIRAWVQAGGTLIGFGPGCLAWTIEPDRSLKSTPAMDGMLPPAEVKQLAEKLATQPAAQQVAQPAEKSEPTTPTEFLKYEARLGQGRVVLYLNPADPVKQHAFTQQATRLLADEAVQTGLRRVCHVEADGAPTEDINLLDCGSDLRSGRRLFVLDLMRQGMPELKFWHDRAFDLIFDPAMQGEAELVAATDSFKACEDGQAQYNPQTRILTVRFQLPSRLKLSL